MTHPTRAPCSGSRSPTRARCPSRPSEMLRESGYRQRSDSKELTLVDADNGVEFFYLRPRDIALYVGEGTLDVGITGRDLLLRLRRQGRRGAARSASAAAVPLRRAARAVHRPRPARRHTHRHVVRRGGAAFLEERGIDATVTRLDGAVETSIQLGVADVIADVVETGSTLRQAGPGDLRRADPGVRGGADHPRGGSVPRGLRGLPAPARGRPGRPQLRDDGLRHPERARVRRPWR